MEIQKLNFTYGTTIKAVSAKQFSEHQKLYEGYIKKVNGITGLLKTNPEAEKSNSTYSHYRGLKESETFAIDAVMLHELYFENLGGLTREYPAQFADIVTNGFGSFEKWVADFTACAKSARGWVVLCYEQRTQSFRNIMLDSHNNGVVLMGYPLLVLDMYEHAYFLDYGMDKETYIKNFMANVNWSAVSIRCSNLGRII